MKHALLIIIILVLIAYSYRQTEEVAINGRNWHMAGGYDNSAAAAALLESTNDLMIDFMAAMKKKYNIDITDDMTIAAPLITNYEYKRSMMDQLLRQYNPDEFYENDPRTSNQTSWTNNKGESMHICLRNKSDPTKLVDNNLLMFVHLHESSHIAYYAAYGHGPDYWAAFKFLLREAVAYGIYRPVNYAVYPANFCGLNIDHNPLFDSTIPDL